MFLVGKNGAIVKNVIKQCLSSILWDTLDNVIGKML